jgi:hypothetical protein
MFKVIVSRWNKTEDFQVKINALKLVQIYYKQHNFICHVEAIKGKMALQENVRINTLPPSF